MAVKPHDISEVAVKPHDILDVAVKPHDVSDVAVKPRDSSDIWTQSLTLPGLLARHPVQGGVALVKSPNHPQLIESNGE